MDQQNNNQTPGAQPPPAPKPRGEFQNLMTRGEKIAGWIYLPVHVLLLPLLLSSIFYALSGGSELPDGVTLNVWYYLIGLIVLLALQFRFFRESYHVLVRDLRRALLTRVIGYGILVVCNVALNLIVQIFGSLPGSPNDDAVESLAQIDNRRMAAIGVIMAPIVEEALFRGMIFGSIRPKSRVAAYVVSIVLFSIYHVWQYAVADLSLLPLVSAVAYVPISFVLAFCYDRTNSIWTPIFFHMFYNALALSLR